MKFSEKTSGSTGRRSFRRAGLVRSGMRWWLLLLLFLGAPAFGAIQFDVFLGYDGIIPDASWFPVVCEIKNDSPTFTATVVLDGGQFNHGQEHRAVVELPTGTLKRLVIPVFASSRGYSTWDLRLVDERGKVRADKLGVRPRKQTSRLTPLMGAIPRTASGTPQIRPILSKQSELEPQAARLLPGIFPDNPLVLEGLSSLYLNSERASDLSSSQVNALLGWLNAGGHLVVAVEQPSDIGSVPWLRTIFPCEVKELKALDHHPELQNWLRSATWATNAGYYARVQGPQYGRPSGEVAQPLAVASPFLDLANDFDFEMRPMQVATGQVLEGRVAVQSGGVPLMVTAERGRGRVTALLFSPEREPVRSWKNLPTFWAKVAEVPGVLYASADFNQQGGWGVDGIFGAMMETRQVHKLPVFWLLLLLLAYLVVIGPLDQFWLKRIGKPMLTWITFPCYVVLFSVVIYVIGYKLRAGESEWNDLYVVDVLVNGERAELRGRTYSSVYSPSNQRYPVSSAQKCATLRGEFAGLWGGGEAGEKATLLQVGDSFKGEVFVPVWTSQLYVGDWWEAAALPAALAVRAVNGGWEVKVDNRLDRKLTDVEIVLGDKIVTLGEVPERQSRTFNVRADQGLALQSFVTNFGKKFLTAVQSRQRAFGSAESGRLTDLPHSAMAASFVSQLGIQREYGGTMFVAQPGLDLSAVAQRGDAVLLAWTADFAPVPPIYHFTPRRSQRHTLWRLAAPVQSSL